MKIYSRVSRFHCEALRLSVFREEQVLGGGSGRSGDDCLFSSGERAESSTCGAGTDSVPVQGRSSRLSGSNSARRSSLQSAWQILLECDDMEACFIDIK